jgi:RNA polymerase sigma-70 factor (sigma-E family)
MERAGTRDRAFTEYVVGRRQRLVRTATLLTAGDRHLAEDLVQGALTRLYVAWPRVRAEGRDAYLYRTLANLLIDEKRRGRWLARDVEPPHRAVVDGSGSAEHDAVREALGRLPAGMRAAVVLRYWCDLDVEATARALGCSTGNVKSQTARGIERLRGLIGSRTSTWEMT